MGRGRTCTDLFQGQASYRLLNHAVGAWRRLRTADLRVTRAMLLPSELSRPGGPRAVGPGGTTRTCTSLSTRPLLRRLRLPISPRPGGSDELERSARFCSRGPDRCPVTVLASAELRQPGEEVPAAGVEPAVRPRARHVLGVVRLPVPPRRHRVARVGFRPTVSAVKERHARALHQRAMADWCPRQELNLEPHG